MRQTVKNDTAKEIKRGGFADVNQILESLVPGLYVSTKTERADRTRMSLNGGGINQIVFLLDGVRINNRLYGDGNLDTLQRPSVAILPVVILEKLPAVVSTVSATIPTTAKTG